jgi:hypothetical protein
MVTLNSVIEDLQAEFHLDTDHKKSLFLRLAKNGIRDLHYTVNGKVKRVTVEPNTAGVVELPNDCVKVVNVSISNSSGKLVFLGRNKNIYKPVDGNGNEYQPTSIPSAATASSTESIQHYKNGEIIGGFYGIGGHSTVGDYHVSLSDNRIELSSNLTNTTLVLDYLGNPQLINGEYLVHEFLVEPLMKYIVWKYKRQFVSYPEQKAMQSDYTNAKAIAKMKLNFESQEGILDASRKNFSQAPKF